MDIKNGVNAPGMADIYLFLAQSMRYPEKEWMSDEFLRLFLQIAEKIPELSDSKSFRSFLSRNNLGLECLQEEYTRLFINVYPHVLAPPYGSAYSSNNLRNDGGSSTTGVDETVLFYHEKGFELVDCKEPPDWLIHELAFMALMAKDDPEGLEKFLVDHFRPWFTIFKKKVVQETINPYFVIAIQMIDFFTV
jgi:TorA maturation chaperone TorD